MKTGIVYAVSNSYGIDGLMTKDELISYCREWWADVSEHSDYPDHESLNDQDILLEYFEIQAEFGLGEFYDSFMVREDMLTEEGQ